jgi:hypothetical protein
MLNINGRISMICSLNVLMILKRTVKIIKQFDNLPENGIHG